MGTITARKRRDGTRGFTAQIRITRRGLSPYSESQTFDRKPAAAAWIKRRETELSQPGALKELEMPDPTLEEAIGTYLEESRREYGKTKIQVLRTISASSLGKLRCSEIGSAQILNFVKELEVKPQTAGNYLAHLAAVFTVARPAWGYKLNKSAIDDARIVGKRMGVTSRSDQRTRRPTLSELDKLLDHFRSIRHRRPNSIAMDDIVLFALFSSRRLDEITRITVEDLDESRSEILVRDMKHPGEKIGNDVRVCLPPQALSVIIKRKPESGRIFDYKSDSISASLTRACKLLGIDDLHFHDLRHEGVSRLFKMGWTIPQVATVSGHRTWTSLKRYTHIQNVGDKYAHWRWTPHDPS